MNEDQLSNYFGEIPHTELMKSLARRISDGRMLGLIKAWLEMPVEEDDGKGGTIRTNRARREGKGIPQGAPISPSSRADFAFRVRSRFGLPGGGDPDRRGPTELPQPERELLGGTDGLRWHIRAFCHIDHIFKDFILSRCLNAGNLDAPGATPEDDRLWHERFAVALAPNPTLSDSQRAVVAQDYEMKGGFAEVPVRKALLYHFQKKLRLDVADKFDNPHEIPVVVANRADFDAALAEAMA